MDDIPRGLQDALDIISGGIATIAVAVVVAILVLLILWKVLRRPKTVAVQGAPQLVIDVATLGEAGPPPGPPVLEFYNIPVRVAAVIMAPAGRIRDLPPPSELPKLYDAIVPELDKVIAAHNPVVRRWPTQVSARGFAHVFFNSVRLPGDGGKGTPWSAAAGLFKFEGQTMMAALVFRAGRSNSFGQVVIDSEEKWLGCLRVREG